VDAVPEIEVVPAATVMASRRRPDILRHRPGGLSEWYEIKPLSIAGAIDAWKKFRELSKLYAGLGLPYQPGKQYTPTKQIPIASFFTPQGGKLDVIVELTRGVPGGLLPAPALIFWTLCIKGDYIQYFNELPTGGRATRHSRSPRRTRPCRRWSRTDSG
jgi:hypothetical protein